MADLPRQSTAPPRNALIGLCQRLRPKLLWFRTAVVLVLVLNILPVLSTTKSSDISGTALGWVLAHWPLILTVGGLFLVLTWVVGYLGRPVASPARALPTPQDRRELIRRLSDEYRGQQTESLQKTAMKSLERQEPVAVTLSSASLISWRMDAPGKPSLAAPAPIMQAYEQARTGLLILGTPGVGKSTLLLELALGLLTRAEQDKEQSIPVLVNLSSWALNKPPLSTWLEEQLYLMIGISRRLSHVWIEQNEFLLLLDGLDEMEPSARTSCVAAIEAYRERAEHLVRLVVCSRHDEYLAQEGRLRLLDTVEVQPLTPEQVDGYLKGGGKPLKAVRTALRRDAVLRDLVTTPLMLSAVMLAYRGKTDKDLPHLGTEKEQQHQVLEHYVTRMLDPMEKPTRKWRYTPDATRKWLIWLAQQMKQRRLTEFYLERLQPGWLLTTVSTAPTTYPCLTTLIIMLLSAGLSFGLLFVPLFVSNGNPGWFVVGLFLFICTAWGYALGVPFGFGLEMMGFSRKRSTLEIRPAELLVWSWKGSWLKMLLLLVEVTLVALVGFHMPYWLSNLMGLRGYPQPPLATELLVGLFLGVALVACIILITGVSSTHLSKQRRTAPNQGIHNSGWNALRFGLAGMMLFGLLALLGGGLAGFTGISGAWEVGLVAGLVIGAFAGPFWGLFFGGGAYLQHYILRFLLWRARSTPWHYVRFLDDAKERVLLQRVGGGYRFIHPLFQEYFASLASGTPASTQSRPSSPQL